MTAIASMALTVSGPRSFCAGLFSGLPQPSLRSFCGGNAEFLIIQGPLGLRLPGICGLTDDHDVTPVSADESAN